MSVRLVCGTCLSGSSVQHVRATSLIETWSLRLVSAFTGLLSRRRSLERPCPLATADATRPPPLPDAWRARAVGGCAHRALCRCPPPPPPHVLAVCWQTQAWIACRPPPLQRPLPPYHFPPLAARRRRAGVVRCSGQPPSRRTRGGSVAATRCAAARANQPSAPLPAGAAGQLLYSGGGTGQHRGGGAHPTLCSPRPVFFFFCTQPPAGGGARRRRCASRWKRDWPVVPGARFHPDCLPWAPLRSPRPPPPSVAPRPSAYYFFCIRES